MKQLYNIYNPSGGKYEVVHEDKHGYLVNHPDYPKDSYRFWVKKNDPKSVFEEYKEPRKLTRYINVFANKKNELQTSRTHLTKNDAECAAKGVIAQGLTVIDTIEIHWEEKNGQNR